MESAALALFVDALRTAVELAFPVVGIVAIVGVAFGILQTIVQIQDQNVAFGPKLAAVALLVSAAGPAALALLRGLLTTAISALPAIAHA